MARTTAEAVKGILLSDYGSMEGGGFPSLTPFIDAANAIVSRVATCAIAKGKTLSTAELELIERWLSAHFYVQSDQTLASDSAGGASASFHGRTSMYLESSRYGQTAAGLDFSGCLNSIVNRKTAGAAWLGKVPSEQIDYVDRS